MKTGNRENEKGAALVMVVMITLLLLAAVGGLLLEVSMNTANVTDSTAEQQAYNAAESGIQSAINVLRGNTPPDPLFNTTNPASIENKIDFRKAVSLSKSNLSGDTSTSARLSRWMKYNYTPSGASQADRIKLNDGYEPRNGYAFSVEVIDPDNTGEIISHEIGNSLGTYKIFYDDTTPLTPWKQSVTVGSGSSTAVISYTPPTTNPTTNLDVSSGSVDTNFGKFTVASSATSITIDEDVRFKITIKMIAPYQATKEIRGWIKEGDYTTTKPLQFEFDSTINTLMGSTITLANNPMSVSLGTASSQSINANMTQAEPYRVVVRSTGYGPRGSKKVLEATVQKNFFNGLSAPSPLTLVGKKDGFVFNAGTSQNVTYSGINIVLPQEVVPAIGTTNEENLTAVYAMLDGRSRKADIFGPPENIEEELPFWLESATNLHTTIESLKTVSQSSGRYFPSGQTPSNFGNNATAKGITFVDGDVELSGDGGGILVVTGKLTLHGAVNFNGLIIVTGAGGVDRRGGGNGVLRGNTVIAPYDKTNPGAGFLAPKYDISGGGTSEIRYDSSSVANGMTAVSNFVLGVAEK
jgi:Tfp pilus assembly protein PilX